MADRDDLEFTYSLIDRIFRLSLGELADFSGAKYDGDFSLTLEEAQRRKHEYVAEQIGIGPGRRVLDLGCGWGPLLDFVRRRGAHRRRGDAVLGAGRRLPAARAGRPPPRRAASRAARRSARFDAVASLGAFEHFCSPEEHRAGRQDDDLPRPVRPHRGPAARRRPLLPPDDGVRAQHDPARARSTSRAPRDSDAWYLALMGRQFPGSLLPFGEEQIVRSADPHFRLVVERERPARLHRDDPPVASAVRRAERAEEPARSCGCCRAG